MFALELKVEFVRTGFLRVDKSYRKWAKDKEMSRALGTFWMDTLGKASRPAI